MNKYMKNTLIFIGLAFGFFTFSIVYALVGIDLSNITLKQNIILSIIEYIIFLILLFIIYRKYLKEKWVDLKKNFKSYMDVSLKYWLTGFIGMFVSNNIIMRFITDLGENENAVQEMISGFPFLALLMVTVFAPIIEELIFRKSLQDAFKSKLAYAVMSGLIFGYIHVMGSTNPFEYLLIIPYGSLGVAFACILNKTDNVYCSILMHMLHNSLSFIFSVVL